MGLVLVVAAFLSAAGLSALHPAKGDLEVRPIPFSPFFEAGGKVSLRIEMLARKEVSIEGVWRTLERPSIFAAAGPRIPRVSPVRLPAGLPRLLASGETLSFSVELRPAFPGLTTPGNYRLVLEGLGETTLRLFPAGFDAKEVKRIVLVTDRGSIVIRLDPTAAPANVDALCRLAASRSFDGMLLDRLLPGRFLAMETMPLHLRLPLENPDGRHVAGAVGLMRRRGDPRSAVGSLYFCLQAMPELDRSFTILGCLEEPRPDEVAAFLGARIIATELE